MTVHPPEQPLPREPCTWSVGDEAVLWAISEGWAPQSWQIAFLSFALPEPFQPIPKETR